MKYAVKIMLSADDWIYITHDTSRNCWDLTPVTFDDRKDAERFAETWRLTSGDTRFVKVVEYDA